MRVSDLNISENVIIRSGSETLEDNKLVTEVHNTEYNVYDIIATENDDESSSSDEKEEDASHVEPNHIEEAFQVEYQGTILETFYSRLKQFHDEYSGSGKTRLVGELKTKGTYILYICKRHESSSAIKEIKNKNWSAEEFWNIQIKDDHKTERNDFWQSVFESLLQQKKLSSDYNNENFVKKLFPDTEISIRRQIQEISWAGFFNILLTPLAENVGKEYDYKRVVYLGIPLWGSLAQAGVSLIHLVHLASQKICNFSKKNNDYLANLACIACSLSLEVSSQIAEVDSLIASYIATAIGVSLDRTSILCTYPSDTILAFGALKGIIDVGWKNCLDTLLELFSHGVVKAGERGELVNRILFSKAYADAVKECFSSSPLTYLQKVPLKSFLKSLLCEEIDGLDELLKRMATNQDYVKSRGMKFLSENLVIEAYHRHTAFKMSLGFHVIDHIIPFKYNIGYDIISIQNKNAKKTTFGAKDISSLIHPLNSFSEWKKDYKILDIYIDLGLDREKAVEPKAELKSRNIPQTRSKNKNNEDKKDEKNDYDQIIHIQGVRSFKYCDDEISKRLSKILFTRP
ncbi:5292_t:CDS:2 [Funneliformis caledonium]|uniref:5292_t:CDS:1 n=1 Tax=Funneliformis caledonium TaxID=1117310 RepID=A0A9N9BBZ3_9GLOM|nr:5292_t:CDS:2 [Funneliformis caledonium]